MLSCVHRLDDLLILCPFSFSKIRCHPSKDTHRNQTHLLYHHLSTMIAYGTLDECQLAELQLAELKHPYSSEQLSSLLGADIMDFMLVKEHPKKRRRIT